MLKVIILLVLNLETLLVLLQELLLIQKGLILPFLVLETPLHTLLAQVLLEIFLIILNFLLRTNLIIKIGLQLIIRINLLILKQNFLVISLPPILNDNIRIILLVLYRVLCNKMLCSKLLLILVLIPKLITIITLPPPLIKLHKPL